MIKGEEIAQSEVIDFIGLICFGVAFGFWSCVCLMMSIGASVRPGKVDPMPSENAVIAREGGIFRVISRYRILFFSSPLWVAAILVILARFAGQNVRDVIQFMTASPLR